ncbi:acetate--CoA ligase family protein [Achromobacter sp. GG226]|uniref:acetate--CoA ligase family protein n=1 Tax=Verticiella alkaliphila TaxID=2779529 RepID=UPI001C0C6008|nr:acetate--CoA ligase family protein [Verticiella sp. GG226]MBU4611471.1 acetate--CoA ligase family protein [Verticiella sp. GG226]
MIESQASSLTSLFNPRSVALIGASDNPASIGGRTLANLLDHSAYRGEVYLVNARRERIGDRPCYRSVDELPAVPEMVIVAVPADTAVPALEACGRLGVRYAIVFTSGFGEGGGEGQEYAERLRRVVADTGMRIYGPNCPGLCNVNERIGFTFSPSFRHDLRAGPIGLITQGGGLGRNVMQTMDRGVGIGLWASTGNELDLQVADFIEAMADTSGIEVIAILLEGINDGPRFVRAVQRATRRGKPIVAFKVGRSEYGSKAAQSHTASITGSAEVNSAVFRQLGVIEVDDIDELADTAWLLARAHPAPNPPDAPEPGLAVYCSSGGTTAMTADAIGLAGLTLVPFAESTTVTLRGLLPSYASIVNPIDTTTAVLADDSLIEKTMLAVCRDPGVAMVILPMALDYGEVTATIARRVAAAQTQSPVPIVPIWMSERTGEGYGILRDAGMAPMRSVSKAVKALRRWVDHGRWLASHDPEFHPAVLHAGDTPQSPARAMTESKAKTWLREAGMALPQSHAVSSRDAAMAVAQTHGIALAAKVLSADIQHKSDVGGVRLGLAGAEAVGRAWDEIHASVRQAMPQARIEGLLLEPMAPVGGLELLVGISRDPVLGPMMTVGLGGIYVEIFRDVARRMLPVSVDEAERMLRELRCYPLLAGARGQPPRDEAALARLLAQVSDIVLAQGARVAEIDLNPVWVGRVGEGAYPLDAVIVAHDVASVS